MPPSKDRQLVKARGRTLSGSSVEKRRKYSESVGEGRESREVAGAPSTPADATPALLSPAETLTWQTPLNMAAGEKVACDKMEEEVREELFTVPGLVAAGLVKEEVKEQLVVPQCSVEMAAHKQVTVAGVEMEEEVEMEVKEEPLIFPDLEAEGEAVKEEIGSRTFFGSSFRNKGRSSRWLAPPDGEESDVSLPSVIDDDVLDPDFALNELLLSENEEVSPQTRPSKSKKRANKMVFEDLTCEEEEEDSSPPAKKAKTRAWVKGQDISVPPLPPYEHPKPAMILSPIEYFNQFFTSDLMDHIVYQTNLYARQKDLCTSFKLDVQSLRTFLGLIIYMGITACPSIEDYWAVKTRVSQVADYMSRDRFKQIRSLIHFNDNKQARTSTDRFYKIRPLFDHITTEFSKVPETPVNSIDEVMVAYKGGLAGTLRQYIQNKPDKWGYKLFCRASVDGFIHDILMYQGETTFSSHHTQLSDEEDNFNKTAKTVITLVKSMQHPHKSAVYADNYFTSAELAEYLLVKYKCRYVGTARPNRIGYPPLQSTKEMEKKSVARGDLDYCSCDGVLVSRWKDNKVVTVLSTDAGINPTSTLLRYDRVTKTKKEVPCPDVIKKYNGHMGGVDKSDMLTHLYKTPMRARRYYMRLFGYVVDLVLCNSWLLYKRDCKSLEMPNMPLKDFRLEVSQYLRCDGDSPQTRVSKTALQQRSPMTLPKRGQRAEVPSVSKRQDATSLHMPVHVPMRQTCKHCSKKGSIHRSRWMCDTCKVALCLSEHNNCFEAFHKNL